MLMLISWLLAGIFLLFGILNTVIVIVPEGYIERIVGAFVAGGVATILGFIFRMLKVKKK